MYSSASSTEIGSPRWFAAVVIKAVSSSKSTSILCDIRVTGVSEQVLSGLDVTKEYFLSDTVAGGIATTIPTASGYVKLKLGQPFSDKKFLMLKGERQVRL